MHRLPTLAWTYGALVMVTISGKDRTVWLHQRMHAFGSAQINAACSKEIHLTTAYYPETEATRIDHPAITQHLLHQCGCNATLLHTLLGVWYQRMIGKGLR